jgi:acyl-CoA thioesterase
VKGFKELLGLEVVEAVEGEARIRLVAATKHLNPHGTVHGGVIATLADCAMGEAVRATGDEDLPVTVEMKVNYLEAGREGGLIASARVHKNGSRFTVLEADVTQEEDGTLIAFATGTFTSVD